MKKYRGKGRGNGEEINKAFFDCISHKSELILFINPKGRIPRACPWGFYGVERFPPSSSLLGKVI